MASSAIEINKYYDILKNQALDRNEKSVATWTRYKDDLVVTKSLLSLIPKNVKHDVMVPIGSKALFYGQIMHSNEFLVNLGETWFISRSAFQATEICDRRIKTCDEMLKKLETEKQLIVNKSVLPAEHDAFGNEERPEINEFVTEDENDEWMRQHRLKEKKYRQQLAELRNQEIKKIETEEDLWQHLDELELQEELEDELNRLNAEYSNEDLIEEKLESHNLFDEQSKNLYQEDKNGSPGTSENKTACEMKIKRHVSFSSDYNSSEDEPLRLEIKHSEGEPVLSYPNNEEINSPSDIYNHYKKLHSKTIKSVLKNKSFLNNNDNSQVKQSSDVEDFNSEEGSDSEIPTSSFCIKDVTERKISDLSSIQKVNSDTKKISKFKTLRMKLAGN